LKILHIIDSGGLYGAEMVLLNLVAEQIKLGLEPTIASIGEKHIEEKPLEAEALRRGFKVKKFRMFPGPNIAGAFKILRYAQRNGFDLLHSHGYKGNVQFGLMPKSFRKIPLIATAHGWTSTKGFTKNRIYEWLDTLSFKFIDAVVLVNKGMLNSPKLKNRKGINIHIVNNGIPIPDNAVTRFNDLTIQPTNQSTNRPFNQSPSQFNNLTNQQLDKEIVDFCSNAYTIGSIGRLSTEKGYKYLIQALSLLVKNGIDARLVIIGEGYERGLLEELVAQLELKDRILLPGYRDNAKYYIPYFKAFVISSLTEGLPITLLEAMQARVPVVSTSVGGIPEVLDGGKAGMLVNPAEPELLAKAVIQIYDNGIMTKKFTETAYQRLIFHYSSSSMAKNYLILYESILAKKI